MRTINERVVVYAAPPIAWKRRKWIDADSRNKEIGNLGNKAESETRLARSATCDHLQPVLLRPMAVELGNWSERSVINLAHAHPIKAEW